MCMEKQTEAQIFLSLNIYIEEKGEDEKKRRETNKQTMIGLIFREYCSASQRRRSYHHLQYMD